MIFERTKKRTQMRRTTRPSFARHMLWGLLLFLVLALLGTAVYYGTRIQTLTIQAVEISGGVTIPEEVIRQEVMGELQGSYGRLVPHAFALTYPHDAIVRALLSHPRLYEPRVERKGSTVLLVEFREYEPHALLCGKDVAHPCFLIDESGFAFEEAGALSGGALTRYIEASRDQISRGDTISADRLSAAERFIKNTEDILGFRIGTVTYTEDQDIQFGINGGGELLVSGLHNLDESFENIRTVLQVDAYTKLTPGTFQYVDARFPPKIFVNDTPPNVATSTEDAATGTPPAI